MTAGFVSCTTVAWPWELVRVATTTTEAVGSLMMAEVRTVAWPLELVVVTGTGMMTSD